MSLHRKHFGQFDLLLCLIVCLLVRLCVLLSVYLSEMGDVTAIFQERRKKN